MAALASFRALVLGTGKSTTTTTSQQSLRRDRRVSATASSGGGGSDNGSSMRVGVTGGTGFVGKALVHKLIADGHNVIILTRDASTAKLAMTRSEIKTESMRFAEVGEWKDAIDGCDSVVNLAGEPVSTRWSDGVKAEVRRSRLNTTQKVVDAINSAVMPPKVLVNASAVGYYGTSQVAEFTEDGEPGSDFLARVCVDWENEAKKARPETRLCLLRIGLVLEKDGGVMAKMLPVFQSFAGGPLGSGEQWMSWIHREDLCNIILKMLTDESMKGVYNGTAPRPVRMNEFCETLSSTLARPNWLPVPEQAIQLLLGEGAILVTQGQKVVPRNLMKSEFEFKYQTLKQAFESMR